MLISHRDCRELYMSRRGAMDAELISGIPLAQAAGTLDLETKGTRRTVTAFLKEVGT